MKIFKTIEEQIEILKQRGLIINNYNETRNIKTEKQVLIKILVFYN
ncbi:MAG: hypothetical protein PHD15_05920 [Clostridia bacterium]|nr:hypothetical protein [Clostridia bacterium]MDD4387269.1 hypothetical protein [Clostridia bacterium]